MLSNKAPVWSYENQSYVLNFHGRVTRVSPMLLLRHLTRLHHKAIFFQASVKNFQMETEPGNVIMQFGRVGTDTFTMDFRWAVIVNMVVVKIMFIFFLFSCHNSQEWKIIKSEDIEPSVVTTFPIKITISDIPCVLFRPLESPSPAAFQN